MSCPYTYELRGALLTSYARVIKDDGLSANDMNPKRDKVIATAIARAFEHTKRPSDDQIVTDPNSWVADDLLPAFQGKDWQEISDETVYLYRLELGYFTPEALRYYLPAFLVRGLRSTISSPAYGEMLEMVFYALVMDEHEALRNRLENLVSSLDEPQKNAIKRFLRHFIAENRPYWDKFEKQVKDFWGA